MKKITTDELTERLKAGKIKPRLRSRLRFNPDNIENWEDMEFIAVFDQNHKEGVMLLDNSNHSYVIPFSLTTGLTNKSTGRSNAITCDFCATWQIGKRAASITIINPSEPNRTFGFLCCTDLDCSSHVRNKTAESVLSRTQLREDLTVNDRIVRLKKNLNKIIENTNIQSISI